MTWITSSTTVASPATTISASPAVGCLTTIAPLTTVPPPPPLAVAALWTGTASATSALAPIATCSTPTHHLQPALPLYYPDYRTLELLKKDPNWTFFFLTQYKGKTWKQAWTFLNEFVSFIKVRQFFVVFLHKHYFSLSYVLCIFACQLFK